MRWDRLSIAIADGDRRKIYRAGKYFEAFVNVEILRSEELHPSSLSGYDYHGVLPGNNQPLVPLKP